MRKDVKEALNAISLQDLSMVKKNRLAEKLNCNRRTIDRYIYERQNSEEKTKRIYKSCLDVYKEYIKEKTDSGAYTAMDVFKQLQKRGYEGSYETLANFIKNYRNERKNEMTIAFKEKPGNHRGRLEHVA